MLVEPLFEDELEAARDVVKHLGGAKKVGPMIWPDKTPDAAARHLHDCLNPHRAERLSPSQLLLLMRLGCKAGVHSLTAYMLRAAGYAPPVALAPQTEEARLVGRIEALLGEVSTLTTQFERIKRDNETLPGMVH